jgi:hypothetical protein
MIVSRPSRSARLPTMVSTSIVGALSMAKQKVQDVEQPASLPAEKPEPTHAERAEVRDYLARAKVRRRAPRFTVERRPGKLIRLDQTQVHPGVAAVRMMNALGTTSVDLADRLVNQVLNAIHLQPPGQPVSEENLNAALAAVTGIGPKDEAEAMLVTQMVGVHWMAMDLLRQVGATDNRALLNDAGNLAQGDQYRLADQRTRPRHRRSLYGRQGRHQDADARHDG